jgi:kynureninase
MTDVAQLDAADPLAALRERFLLPEDIVYLDGNSLGALPRAVPDAVDRVLRQQWGGDLIASWNRHDWIGLPTRVGERIAALIGAAPGQVLCVDSISVNLFKLLAAALDLRPRRDTILTLRGDFPTDAYIAGGLADWLGPQRCRVHAVEAPALNEHLDERVAVLLLTQVNYRSGERFDMAALTAAAHDAGALVVWDLAHSAGVMPIDLDACAVDFAVGCGYKFLNGGPGAPAFLYVNTRHQGGVRQPLSGWLGHATPFDFAPQYRPAPGVRRFQAGTPPIVSMAALEAALGVFNDVDLNAVRRKSLALGDLFLERLAARPALRELNCITPREHARRGSQLSLRHEQAWGISQALIDAGVIVDFRAPDILRLGFAPLYNCFADVEAALAALERVMVNETYRDPAYDQRPAVT